MVNAAISGKLDSVEFAKDPVFKLNVPKTCPDVPPEILFPRNTWTDKDAYDVKARELIGRFEDNFKQFLDRVPPNVLQAAPGVK